MDIESIEKLTIGDLKQIYKCNNMSIKEAIPIMREFRDRHNLTDKESLSAFSVAKRIFGE